MTALVPHIRPALPADAPDLEPLLAAVGFPVDVPTIAHRLEALAGSADLALAADLEGRIVGLLTAHLTPALHRPHPVGRITLLAVAESVQRRGIGRALMMAAEHELSAAGCTIVEAISNRRFKDAHAFYEGLGYDFTSLKFKKVLPPVFS